MSGFKRSQDMKNFSSSNLSTDRQKYESNSKNLNRNNTSGNLYNSNNNQSTKNKTFEPQDSNEYLRFRMDELNNELVQRINKNKLQAEQIANLGMKIDTYKKNISSLHDRIAKQDNMKIEITLQNKKISELERDLNNGFMENK